MLTLQEALSGAMLEIRLLGPFKVYRRHNSGGGAVTFPNETVRRLFKLLALHPNEPMHADTLSEVCWPGAAGVPRTALHVAISRLRRCLEPELEKPMQSRFIVRSGTAYTFVPGDACRIDYRQYGDWAAAARERAANADWTGVVAAMEAAESLRRGELLACEPYADWAEPSRRHFAQVRAELLEIGLTAHGRLGQWASIIRLARRLITEDNTREHAYRFLMQAYANTGEYGLALAAFEECRRALVNELGVEPSPATLAIYQTLLGSHTADRSAAATRPAQPGGLALLRRTAIGSLALPLTGRGQLLQRIPALLRAGHFVVLHGEAGVGKSRLAAEVLTRLAADNCDVYAGLCLPRERARPYEPLAEALGPLWTDGAKDGARQSPAGVDSHTGGPDDPYGDARINARARARDRFPVPHPAFPQLTDSPDHLFQNVLGALLAAAAQQAVIVCLDDVHWADADTLAFLERLVPHLGSRPAGGSLAVLVTVRSEELADRSRLRDCLAAVRRSGWLHEITIPPLTERDLTDIVVARAAEPRTKATALARQLFDDSKGIALFAVERLRSLLDSGQIKLSKTERWRWDDHLTVAGLAPPAAVRDLARQRAAALSPAAHRLLLASVVLRRNAPFQWLAAVAGGEPAALLHGLEQLLQRRLLIAAEMDGRTTYSVGHDLIREALYEDLLPERRHYLHRAAAHALAQLPASDHPVPAALIAEQYRAGGAGASAVDWYRRAAAAARATAAAGEARAHLEQALSLAQAAGDPARLAGCCEDLADLLAATSGWTDEIAELYETAASHAQTALDRTRVWLRSATACLPVDAPRALALAERAAASARSLYAREHLIWALALQAAAHGQAGRDAAAEQCAAAAVAVFNEPDQTLETGGGQPPAAVAPPPAVRFETIWQATRLLRRVGHAAGDVAGFLYLADVAALSAQWPETETWARHVLSLTSADEEEHALAEYCLAWIASRRADYDRCQTLLEALAERAADRQWAGLRMAARLLLVSCLAEQRRIDAAHELLDETAAEADAIGELRSQVLCRYLRAYVHWCAGDDAAARDWAESALAVGHGHLQRLDLVHLRRILGIAQLGLGEWHTALALADQNLATAAAADMHYDAALALGIKGKCLAMLGDTEQGRAAIVEAIARLKRLGARRSVREAQAMLAELDTGLPSGPAIAANETDHPNT